MGDLQVAIDMTRATLLTALLISGPLLLTGLVVGLLVSVFQAMTQLQEMTLTFIPKILAVFAVMFVLFPWMVRILSAYTMDIFAVMAMPF